MLNNLMTGLALMASAESFIAIFIGLLAGIIIGAIPGLTADIAIILCLPITTVWNRSRRCFCCLACIAAAHTAAPLLQF